MKKNLTIDQERRETVRKRKFLSSPLRAKIILNIHRKMLDPTLGHKKSIYNSVLKSLNA